MNIPLNFFFLQYNKYNTSYPVIDIEVNFKFKGDNMAQFNNIKKELQEVLQEEFCVEVQEDLFISAPKETPVSFCVESFASAEEWKQEEVIELIKSYFKNYALSYDIGVNLEENGAIDELYYHLKIAPDNSWE